MSITPVVPKAGRPGLDTVPRMLRDGDTLKINSDLAAVEFAAEPKRRSRT
jgi:hypothetical protein